MSYLLDTHALLWALTDPSKLGAEARAEISSRNSTLFVSSASAGEISTKHRSGKLPQADVLLAGYTKHLNRLVVIRLPLTEEQSLLRGSRTWTHRDPFDRTRAAQAMLESLTLITNDPAFNDLPGVRLLW